MRPLPKRHARKLLQRTDPIHIILKQPVKGPLTLADHHAVKRRIFLQKMLCIVRDLRSSCPDLHIRQHLFYRLRSFCHLTAVPDITRKQQKLRFSPVNPGKNFLHLVVDRVLRQFHQRFIFSGGALQTVDRQVGMDVFRVDRSQQNPHRFLSSSFFFTLGYCARSVYGRN